MAPADSSALDRDSPVPLWSQVHDALERRVTLGEFADGFPTENQIAADYGVSRHTVRAALRPLREAGLVDAGRGRITRVATPEITQPQGTLYSLFAAVEATGKRQRSVVRSLTACADGTIATRLRHEESTPLVHLERLRLADEEPLAIDRVWLLARVAAPLLESDFTHTSVYAELDRRCGVRLSGGREQVRAVLPTPAERRLLQLPDDAAALAIDRIGEWRGEPIEWRRTIVRGDRFGFVTELGRPDLALAPSTPPWTGR